MWAPAACSCMPCRRCCDRHACTVTVERYYTGTHPYQHPVLFRCKRCARTTPPTINPFRTNTIAQVVNVWSCATVSKCPGERNAATTQTRLRELNCLDLPAMLLRLVPGCSCLTLYCTGVEVNRCCPWSTGHTTVQCASVCAPCTLATTSPALY